MSIVDPYFARFMARLAQNNDDELRVVFGDLAHALTTQHSCIDLTEYDNGETLRSVLAGLSVVGNGSDRTPLVLEGTRLFLRRYYGFEVDIAARLVELNQPLDALDDDAIRHALDAEFEQPSKQKLAALQALTRRLTVVAGGPGTGKTTTVAGILRAIRQLDGNDIRIKLAAPTGKAAMRLKSGLNDIADLPDVKTLHRLLGYRPDTGSWRHDVQHPLLADVVVIDEVSMIDLAMMHRLLRSLPGGCRLLLLGDPGQLPSVEAGNLLADISKYGFHYTEAFAVMAKRLAGVEVESAPPEHALQDALCELTESHRFSSDRGIGRLSASVKNGIADLDQDDEVALHSIDALTDDALNTIFGAFIDGVERELPAAELAMLFDAVRILVPFRDGDYGVRALNQAIESRLRKRGLARDAEVFYHGRPILVTRNDYTLQLYNGDIGICTTLGLEEPRVVFPGVDGDREYLASRLPEHESCFAMTVHKSQGSEFEHVVLALPASDSPRQAQLLTREMLYTAITRARSQLTLYYDAEALKTCLEQHTVRHSGLGERLLLKETVPEAGDKQEPPGQIELF